MNNYKKLIWRHCLTGPELPVFHKRKGILKIDQSVNMSWHRHGMAVVRSYSSTSVNFAKEENLCSSINIFFGTLHGAFFWVNSIFPSADERGVKNGGWKAVSGIWTHRGKQEKSKQNPHNNQQLHNLCNSHLPHRRVRFKVVNRTHGLWRISLLTSNKFRKLVSRLIIPTALRESLELNRTGRNQGVHHLEVVARDLVTKRCHSSDWVSHESRVE